MLSHGWICVKRSCRFRLNGSCAGGRPGLCVLRWRWLLNARVACPGLAGTAAGLAINQGTHLLQVEVDLLDRQRLLTSVPAIEAFGDAGALQPREDRPCRLAGFIGEAAAAAERHIGYEPTPARAPLGTTIWIAWGVLLMQPSPGGCCGAAGFMRTRSVPCIVDTRPADQRLLKRTVARGEKGVCRRAQASMEATRG